MHIKDLSGYGIEGPDEGKLIIDLSSDWCGPCKTLSPVLESMSERGLFHLIQVNIDHNRELAQKLNISAVPTLLFFRDGNLLKEDIKISGHTVVNQGVMVGAAGELILEEIVAQM